MTSISTPVQMEIAFVAKVMCFSRKRSEHEIKDRCPARIVESISSFWIKLLKFTAGKIKHFSQKKTCWISKRIIGITYKKSPCAMRNSLASGEYLKILKYFELCKNIFESSCGKKNQDSGCFMWKTFINYSIVFLVWGNRMKLVAVPFKT